MPLIFINVISNLLKVKNFMLIFLFLRELEELEAIKEAEEAALAEAEAAAAEAAEAMEGLFGGGCDMTDIGDPGGGDDDDGSPDSPVNNGGPLISGVQSPSRGSLASGVGDGPGSKYAVRDFSHSVDGVNMNNADDSERASVISAPYRSEQSLEVRGAIGSSSIVAGVTGGSGSLGGKLNSLPASPFVRRASKSNSFSSHVRLHEKYGNSSSKKPLVLFTYLDAQEHLPYADDSTAVTPKSELNGGIVVDTPTRMGLARKLSYNSHTGKVDSYNSHTDLRYPPTKEGMLTKRMASLFSDGGSCHGHKMSTPNSILLEPITDQFDINRKPSCTFANNGKKDSVDMHVSDF